MLLPEKKKGKLLVCRCVSVPWAPVLSAAGDCETLFTLIHMSIGKSFSAPQPSDFCAKATYFGVRQTLMERPDPWPIRSLAGDPVVPVRPPPGPIRMPLRQLPLGALLGGLPLCQLAGALPPRVQSIFTSASPKESDGPTWALGCSLGYLCGQRRRAPGGADLGILCCRHSGHECG